MTYKYTTRRPKKMNTNDEVKTRLVFETENDRYIWESPYVDVSMEDILDAFFGMLVSATWQPETVISCMRDYAEDHSYMLDDGCNDSCFMNPVDEDPEEDSKEEKESPHFYA